MLVASGFYISWLASPHLRGSKHQDKGIPPPPVGGRDLANAPAKSAKFHADILEVNKIQARNYSYRNERSQLVFATNVTNIQKKAGFWSFKKYIK